ncbi:MAG: DoxX family membrane protein, partial [Bacteroidetes bacterium]
MRTNSKIDLSSVHLYLFSIVRIAIGWQFLYEGVTKILIGNWSSAPYLAGSKWIFAPLFNLMSESANVIAVVDFMNIWGMILVGLGLMLGLFTRWASAGGALMLLFYFTAYPPVPGYTAGVPVEGSYLWVNKTLIEFFVLVAFSFLSSGYHFSLDRLYKHWKEERARKPVPDLPTDSKSGRGRREAIRDLISLPAIGAFAYALYRKKKWDSFEEK